MVSHCDWKQRCKMFLFANTMIVYVENPESEVTQSCPTLCDPVDCSLLGSSVHGIFQARVLEWVAISFSRGPSDPGSTYALIADKTRPNGWANARRADNGILMWSK